VTVDNFDFTREIITASRGAATAAKYRIEAAHKEEGSAGCMLRRACPAGRSCTPLASLTPQRSYVSWERSLGFAPWGLTELARKVY
jgi:hypothetical protein